MTLTFPFHKVLTQNMEVEVLLITQSNSKSGAMSNAHFAHSPQKRVYTLFTILMCSALLLEHIEI